MKLPEKLHLPAAPFPFTRSDLERDPENTSVAAVFYKAMKENDEQILKRAKNHIKDYGFHEYSEKERKAFQAEYEKLMRVEIDKALQKAILDNNGVVEAFPRSTVESTVFHSRTRYREIDSENPLNPYGTEKIKEVTDYDGTSFDLYFDYFRGVEREEDIPYTSYYSNPHAEELIEKEAKLKERMTRVLNRGKEKLKKFITRIPTLLAIGLDVLLICTAFSNWDTYLSFARAIPYYEFCMEYGSGFSFPHLIGMPILGLFLSFILSIFLDPVVIKGVSKKEAVEEYESFAGSKEYLEAKATFENEKNRYDTLMRSFYAAWYRFNR